MVRTCRRCRRDREHRGRGLCFPCYVNLDPETRSTYPMIRPNGAPEPDMDVDDVVVDRGVGWLITMAKTPRPQRRQIQGQTRPALTRGEKIEVLRRTRFDVPRAVALEALGVSGRHYRPIAAEAGLIPTIPTRKTT